MLNPTKLTIRQNLAVGVVLLSLTVPAYTMDKTVNPSFDVSSSQARKELKQMRQEPVTLKRPVVVISGWGDVMGIASAYLAEQLRKATGDDRIISVPGGVGVTFEDCRQLVIEKLEDTYPSDDPSQTIEVDVIGFSMGGITARYAASDAFTEPSIPRLQIAHLYTISTPHQGAKLAEDSKPIDPLSRDLVPDSEFLRMLNEGRAEETYPIIAYTRLNDKTVGDNYTAPPAQTPYWLAPELFTRSHGGAYHDPRIIADLAKRLRGETPYTNVSPSPLPE